MDVEKAIRENIDRTVHMSLATVRGAKPWVCEVHFAYDGELNLYFRSLPSRRHSQDISQNPHVSGNIIDRYELGNPCVGIYFEGTAEILNAGPAQQAAAECMKTRLQIEEDIVAEAQNPEANQLYKITVSNWAVFGRFGQPSGQKYMLPWNPSAKN